MVLPAAMAKARWVRASAVLRPTRTSANGSERNPSGSRTVSLPISLADALRPTAEMASRPRNAS